MPQSADLDLVQGGVADLDALYPQLVRDFPAAELKSRAQLARLLTDGRYTLYLARPRGSGALAGYALVYEPPAPPLAWLDYLAVEPSARGGGIGAALVAALCDRLAGERLGLLMEVEPPSSADPGVRRDQQRRIAFYERAGARPLAVDYRFPTADGGFPMLLYFRPIAVLDRLPAPLLGEMIAAVYGGIHGDVPGRDALLRRILDTIPDRPL